MEDGVDPLERARAKQRDAAERTTISIPLAMLEDLIKEIEELRDAIEADPNVGDLVEVMRAKIKEGRDAKAPAVHGRPGLRPVGGHEGRQGPARDGEHSPNDAA